VARRDKSEKHELVSLDEAGIVSIGLERFNIDPLRPDEASNQIVATSVFETADGRTGTVGDVALYVEVAVADCGCHSKMLPTVPLDGLIP
jgi:hypothetical protein